jgi:hypothetical protein
MFQPLRAYGFEISPSGFETPSSPTPYRCAPRSGQCTFQYVRTKWATRGVSCNLSISRPMRARSM